MASFRFFYSLMAMKEDDCLAVLKLFHVYIDGGRIKGRGAMQCVRGRMIAPLTCGLGLDYLLYLYATHLRRNLERVALPLIAGLILFFDVYKHDVQFKRMTWTHRKTGK
jgi:hypothetical protein